MRKIPIKKSLTGVKNTVRNRILRYHKAVTCYRFKQSMAKELSESQSDFKQKMASMQKLLKNQKLSFSKDRHAFLKKLEYRLERYQEEFSDVQNQCRKYEDILSKPIESSYDFEARMRVELKRLEEERQELLGRIFEMYWVLMALYPDHPELKKLSKTFKEKMNRYAKD